MGNATASTWIPEVSDADEFADRVFIVFLGISFVACWCVILWQTVVSRTLREVDDWAHRTSLAETQLSEATGLPSASGGFRVDEFSDNEDELLNNPPLLGYVLLDNPTNTPRTSTHPR